MSREYASVFAKLNRNFSAYKPIFGMRIPRIDGSLETSAKLKELKTCMTAS